MKKEFINPEAEIFGVKRNNVIATSIGSTTNDYDSNKPTLAPERMDMPSDLNLLGSDNANEVEE